MLQNDVPGSRSVPRNIDEAISSLSDADCLRLLKAARYLSGPSRYTPEELVNQTLLKALAGDRPYKPEVNLISFLFMTMKSLVSSDCKSQSRRLEISLDTQTHDRGKALLEKLQDPLPSPEQLVETKENLSLIKQSFLDLFVNDDLETQTVAEGMVAEMSKKEIQELTGLDSKSYASTRRLIRRHIDKAFPKGWSYE
ncbi:hypothetical protein BMS3Abin13_01206 [bacterium BMS3Abin13]|nr:hypothetical protein BMS3Abin13_01206 [bacterium BMS3Abin13]